MSNNEQKPIKDKECMHCKKFFDCKGKNSDSPCVNFVERNRISTTPCCDAMKIRKE